jgi:hypothetical protein
VVPRKRGLRLNNHRLGVGVGFVAGLVPWDVGIISSRLLGITSRFKLDCIPIFLGWYPPPIDMDYGTHDYIHRSGLSRFALAVYHTPSGYNRFL